jgi:hypothetical protein
MSPRPRALPDELTLEVRLDEPRDPEALRQRVARELRTEPEALPPIALRKRSLDCRRGRVRYHFLFELGGGEDGDLGAPHPCAARPPS